MEVLTREQAISSKTSQYELPEGLTIDELLAAINWDEAVRDYTVVMLNGHEVSPDYWRRVKPKVGTQMMVAVRPAGGGGGGGSGKQILTAVASIAIMVAAIYVAPMIAGALFPATMAAGGAAATAITAGITAGISMAGTLALAAFVKPPSLANRAITGNPDTGNAPAENSLYGISGGSNSIARYGVVPKLFGRARMTPNMAADPYVIAAGPVQTLRLLLDFGYAPLLVEDIRIGNTPISSFPTARYHLHTWYKAGDPLYIYTNDNATLQVGAELMEGVENIRAAPQVGRRLSIDIGFSNGLSQFDRNGTIFTKEEYIHVLVREQGGGWASIGDFPHWALFGGDSGASVGGERQISAQVVGIARQNPPAITWRADVGEQPQINDFVRWQGQEFQIVGISDANASPPPYTTFEVPTNWLTLSSVPQGINWNFEGNWSFSPLFQEGTAAQIIRKNYTASVGPITAEFGPAPYDVKFVGRSRASRTISLVVDMGRDALWEVRVYRATPVSADPLVSNRITWVSLRAEKSAAPIYPQQHRTILELEVAATEQINGQIQNINALVTAYNLHWYDYRWYPSRNPAMAYVDLLTCSANKNRVSFAEIDLPKMDRWWAWCQQNSAQGDVMATCDLLVESRSTVAEIAQAICAAGRAVPAIIDGKYSVLMEDEPRQPVQMFTHRNTRSMTSSRVWAEEPHALKVRYLSEATWERDELIVYMDGYGPQNATKFETLDLVGTTRPWQAWRMGRYYLAQLRLRKETFNVDVDIENLVCQRGDLVKVGHDQLLNSQVARIMEVRGDTLVLDSFLTAIDVAGPVGLQLRTATGQVLPPVQMSARLDADQIRVPQSLADNAAPGDLIAVGEMTNILTDWLVDEINPSGDLSASLKLIEYRPEIGESDRKPIPAYVPDNSVTGAPVFLGPVRNMIIVTGKAYRENVEVNDVRVDWDPPVGYAVTRYIVERKLFNDVRAFMGYTEDSVFPDQVLSSTIPAGGVPVEYYVTPVSRLGMRGETATVSGMLYPDTHPPETPIITANVLGDSTRIMWTRPASPDLVSYQIRWTSDSRIIDWNQMQILAESVSAETTTLMVHTRSGVYTIRAVDSAGNWSGSSFTRTLVEVAPVVDPSYTVEGPTWVGGRFTNTELDGDGNIRLTKNANGEYHEVGYYDFAKVLDLDHVWRVRVVTKVEMGVFPDDGLSSAHDAQIQVSAAKELPTLDSPWFKPLRTADPLAGDPTNFASWTPVIVEWLDGVFFWTRIILTSKDGLHTPVVKSAVADFYFDPRQEAGSDVLAAGGILEVNYRNAFVQPPSLQLTINNSGRYDYIVRRRTDNRGFRIEVRDELNQLADNRLIDWVAVGIGIDN